MATGPHPQVPHGHMAIRLGQIGFIGYIEEFSRNIVI
jgi:hypothetical protein